MEKLIGSDTDKQLLEAVNKTGRLYLSHAVLADRYSLRFCVGQTATERQHVTAAWRTITEVAERLS